MEASSEQKKDLKWEEEDIFVKLFDKVLEENKEGLSDKDIEMGIKEVKNDFKRNISGSCIRENLNTPEKSCGFFYRYSPLFAGITRRRILTALRDCEELRSCFRRSLVKIIDIGSGAGSALVGLYSALYSYEENIDGEIVRGFPFQSLKVTAMDYVVTWERFFKDIEKKLNEPNYGNASRLFKEKEIECLFRYYDVLNNEKLKEETELREADIIFMKGFLSILTENDDRHLVIQTIASGMKSGSLLVFIDSPTYEIYIQDKNLRLVFTTRRYLPTSADRSPHSTTQSTSLVSQDSELTPQASGDRNSPSQSILPTSAHGSQHYTSESTNLVSQDSELTQQTSDDRNSPSQSLLRKSQAHEASCSASDNVWEHYDATKKPNMDDYYNFRNNPKLSSEIKEYKGGLCRSSNQQIFILEKI